ncbi:ATP synthase F1 subunit epsilon [Candidatus Saccharibacteria bacterium]|nr:ATP synthase F1 subunit epsilon [Candidatus Saccharibacteria bacterium]
MRLELVTLAGVKLDKPVFEVILPTVEGEIAVFPDHESLITVAVPGAIAVRQNKEDSDDQMEYFAISGGVIEISSNLVRVLVDEADHSDEIVESDVKQALERAREMRESATSVVERDKAHQLISRHTTQLKVADLRRRKRRG